MRKLRFAFRQLLKNPGFTAVAVLTLALGIGANTAMFSVINAVLIRPLPFPDSERLVSVWQEYPKRAWPRALFSFPNFQDLRNETSVLSRAGAYALSSHTLTSGGGEPRRLNTIRISASLLPTLKTQPMLGRNFTEEEDRPDGARVALMSHQLWRAQFQGDPAIIGRSIRLNDEWPVIVVGVLPLGFRIGDESPELCLPLRLDPAKTGRGQRGLEVIARMHPGVSAAQLKANLAQLAVKLREADPWANAEMNVNAKPLQAYLVGEIRLPLMLLGGAVGCVLLIACANVANLSLARACGRQSEMTIRSAVGAGRWQLVRLLLIENLLLALIGGGAGLFVGEGGATLAQKFLASKIPQATEIALDSTVLTFTLLAAVGCGFLFGLLPALSGSQVDLAVSLKEDAKSSTVGRGRLRLRNALVVTEVALAFVLLAGAGLLLRSLGKLTNSNPGFEASRMLVAHTVLAGSRYTDNNAARVAAVREMTSRLGSLPGVTDLTFGNSLPLSSDMDASGAALEGRTFSASEAPFIRLRGVGANYFPVLQVPLVDGRYFAESDNETAMKVVVINATMARQFWPEGNAIGKRVRVDALEAKEWLSIVGVVADMKNESLAQRPRPELYFPYVQYPTRGVSLMLRTSVPPLTLAETVRREIRKVDGSLAITELRTMEQAKRDSFGATSFQSLLLGTFAGLALVLAAIGIYSVLSYSVIQRAREIGIRMALGARAASVHTLILAGTMRVVALGIALGLAGALALTRFMTALLFGVGVTDPLTYMAAAAILVGVALVACYLPSRRAARLDPMTALRTE